ncbi:ATP-dependent nuclease [Mucilaginibacter pedocola]|uniref:ATP-dependent endonuclease n=1 Tax=Mucilaginibacter pedocola TaxID=1792845 RepID=A0A1S9P8V6_9SPHI|nr:ATP-dependent endonuclease [Mucilaginibacter pedocola]OOQ57391.1 ATP-dependent endonuclease [Mucilaginibacter pedocola]
MLLKTVSIRNYRRLKEAKIDFEDQTTIFVGANNSGKTSATHVFQSFLGSKPDFSIYDFSADAWQKFDDIGKSEDLENGILNIPTIELDIWLKIDSADIDFVIDLLPTLDWTGTLVGIRIVYGPKDPKSLLQNFMKALTNSNAKKQEHYHPWPISLTDYLKKTLKSEYDNEYYVLDIQQFDAEYNQKEGYQPRKLVNNSERNASKIISSLIRVDFLNAQRHLSDKNSTGRAEDLSKRLTRFYDRNLEKQEDDITALKTLSDSEAQLTSHLSNVFKPTLESLNKLGYPGFSNPQLVIKASMNFESVSQSAKLHYSLSGVELPDQYNGLGFKNLIYMVLEVLDFHERWIENEDNRTPLHLILIEEPEAHLHSQLQQVFISQIWNIIKNSKSNKDGYNTQLTITTHSPHIIYGSGFTPIRYFHRNVDSSENPVTKVLNLSRFYDDCDTDSRDFLVRYMKLTHCDLFFADAAVLVEGNVERLLLPLMIEKCAIELQSKYLSIIEVGGAFTYKFKKLIEFLGLPTLIITDIDSVIAKQVEAEDEVLGDDEDEEENKTPRKSACMVDEPDAETSNQTLIQWLPKKVLILDLLNATPEQRTQGKTESTSAIIHVCYQDRIDVQWEKMTTALVGRTLEESFALQNLSWVQNEKQKHLNLRVVLKTRKLNLAEIHNKIYRRIISNYFNKTEFALGILMANPDEWCVPQYIQNGLKWLNDILEQTDSTIIKSAVEAVETDLIEALPVEIIDEQKVNPTPNQNLIQNEKIDGQQDQ